MPRASSLPHPSEVERGRARYWRTVARCGGWELKQGSPNMARVSRAERDDSRAKLREWVNPGDTLTTVLRHTSASGMYRAIDVYRFHRTDDDRPGKLGQGCDVDWLSYHIARALDGAKWDDKREAVGVGGAGMDMGFHLVYELSYVLFGDGYDCTGEHCMSSDHQGAGYNVRGEGVRHADGYALRHEWLG